MQDGKGALHFIRPQATVATREELRKHSPSGDVKMEREVDADYFGIACLIVIWICVVGLIINCFYP